MLQKMIIGSTTYDVVKFETIAHNPDLVDSHTAFNIDDGYIYPFRNKTDTRPGVYDLGPFYKFVKPQTEEEKEAYSADKMIDFSDSESILDVMSKQAALMNQERTILTTVDNKFIADIGPNDTPHTKALKQAINDKGIDIDKYEGRFGANFNNDRRLLKKSDITMNKFITFLEKMDLTATLTIKDASPDVPNPMGHEITVNLIPADEGRKTDESTGDASSL